MTTLDISQYGGTPRASVDWDWFHETDSWLLPIDHLSASSIDMFLRCPYQWQQRYLKGIRERPAEAPVMGTAVHAGLEYNFGQKITSYADLETVDLVEWFMDVGFARVVDSEQERAGEEVLWDTDMEATKLRARSIVTAYHETVSPRVQPLHVERVFNVDMGLPVPVQGRIDCELEAESIDWKTGKQKTTKPKESWRLQGGVYRVSTGKPVGFHSLSASPRNNAVTIITPLEEEALLVAPTDVEISEMRRMLLGICSEACMYWALYGPDEPWPTKGKFHQWACEYCGFRPSCPAWKS